MSHIATPPYPQPAPGAPTTSEERTLAMLAHVLQIVTGFIGPLILFFVKRDSRFVRYHSLMALFWQLLVMAFWFVIVIVFIAVMMTTVGLQSQQPTIDGNNPPPPFLFFLLPLFWGGGMLIWILNFILGIVYGIKAYDGKWDGYPVIKRWAAGAAGVEGIN